MWKNSCKKYERSLLVIQGKTTLNNKIQQKRLGFFMFYTIKKITPAILSG